MSTPDEAAQRVRMDPALAEMLEGIELPMPEGDDPIAAVKDFRDLIGNFFMRKTDPHVAEHDVHFPARDGFSQRLHVYTPRSPAAGPRPLCVILHGGGTCMGRPEETSYLCFLLCNHFDAICVAPQYRLAPEHPFPQAANDAWDAVQWLAANADQVGASPARGFVVGGISAGANMAAHAALLARDAQLSPPLTGVWIGNGQLLLPELVPDALRSRYRSRTQKECQEAPMLHIKMLNNFNAAMRLDPTSPLLSPYVWPTGHAGLPRTYIQISGMDMYRDEGILYAELLEEAQVTVQSDLYAGMPHCFWQAFPSLDASKTWRSDIQQKFAWLLQAA